MISKTTTTRLALALSVAVWVAPAMGAKRPKSFDYQGIRLGMTKTEVEMVREMTDCTEPDDDGMRKCVCQVQQGEKQVGLAFLDDKLYLVSVEYADGLNASHQAVEAKLAQKYGPPTKRDVYVRYGTPSNRSSFVIGSPPRQIATLISGQGQDAPWSVQKTDFAFHLILIDELLDERRARRQQDRKQKQEATSASEFEF